MLRIQKILEIGYLVMSVFLLINAITTFSTDKKMALMYGLFAIMAGFMFFFKRNFRKRNSGNQNKHS